ncbi:hypothetical protein [Puerhibacterium sp. TATVAM-FAB25]|uniref:hypothetical protein n=1 Tax=Puerhibacterium sp. TATVAM-FAB25 TaxID=3093699 RepID=UPI003979B01C
MVFRRFYRRAFLNRRGHHAGAYALAEIDLCEPFDESDGSYRVDAVFTVADCSRVTTLDFQAHDAAQAANALHKARLLHAMLGDFVVALETAVAEAGLDRPRRSRPRPMAQQQATDAG